jgi:hypothetical protein
LTTAQAFVFEHIIGWSRVKLYTRPARTGTRALSG